MTDIVKKAATAHIKSTLSAKPPITKDIDWTDFNYPPLINVFHYSIEHINDDFKDIFKWMNLYFLSFFGFFGLNFINSIIQTAVGYSWTRIFSSFFYFTITICLSGYGFYNLFKEGVLLKKGSGTLQRAGRKHSPAIAFPI